MPFGAVLPVPWQFCCNIGERPIIRCINHRINTNRLAVSIASAWLRVQSVQMKDADGKVYLNEKYSKVNISFKCVSFSLKSIQRTCAVKP